VPQIEAAQQRDRSFRRTIARFPNFPLIRAIAASARIIARFPNCLQQSDRCFSKGDRAVDQLDNEALGFFSGLLRLALAECRRT